MILNISISDHIRTLGKIGPRFYNSENRKSDHEPTTLKIGPKFEYSEKNGHRSNNSEKSDKGPTTRKKLDPDPTTRKKSAPNPTARNSQATRKYHIQIRPTCPDPKLVSTRGPLINEGTLRGPTLRNWFATT